LGILATATSPATTIAVITETQSKGKYTDLILSSAVVKDFFVIILFAFSLSLSKFMILPSQAFDFAFLIHILKELGISIGTGIGVGTGIILYLRFIKRDIPIFILGIAFFTFQISLNYGYHPLLICLVAGFCVENFSSQGERLIHAIERISLPIYVVFFAISGASLNVGALRQTWILAIICVVWRMVLKYAGTLLAVITVKEDRKIGQYGWAGFISQAGVTLGMVIIIENTFPGWGEGLKALVLAIIALNQIIGPILLQKLFIKVGETGIKEE
jgi:Kef-type K+ transport system membrane component KefB